jgi:hypothetical protein
VSGMPEEHIENLQCLKPQSNLVSNYDYRPVDKYLGQGVKRYFTFTWSELSTGRDLNICHCHLCIHSFIF